MGAICVHEFMSLDGVIDAPIWTFDYGFDAKMGEVLGAVTERSAGVLLGRTTYEMFEPAWSTRTADDDPGKIGAAPPESFLQRLSFRDRSAGICSGKFRRDWRLADYRRSRQAS